MIPTDWQEVRLGELGSCLRGVSYEPQQDLSDRDSETTVRLLRSNNVQQSVLNFDELQFVNQARVSPEQVLRPGDVVVCMANGSKALVGKSGLFRAEGPERYTFGAFMGCFRTDPSKAVAVFVRYLFLTKEYQDYISNLLAGSAINNLAPGSIESLHFAVPSQAEQRAIAEALSDADALVESLEALIAKKREMKQAAMQQLLTGQTRLGGAETSWKGRKIGDLFSFKRTTALSRAQLSADGPCGYVHYGDIHSRWGTHLDLSQEVLPRCSHELSGSASYLEEGDLIMADASEDLEGVGRMVEVRNIGTQKAIAGLHTVLLRPVKGIFAPGFAGFISLMPDFVAQARTLAAGLKVYGLSKSALASIEVRVPDTREQQLVSAVLLDMDAEIDALVAQREKAELVKQGMMQELLSGRVRLT